LVKPIRTLSRSVRGKVVLVTGAGSGMGRATAHVFAAEGAKVAATDLNGPSAEAVAAEIRELGGEAHAWRLDVSDARAIATVVAEIAARLGGLDILINNAGVSTARLIDAPDYDEQWDKALSVLLTAQQRLVRAALPLLKRSGQGRIVNIASTEGLGATPGNSSYSAAKAGVIGLTRGLAVELGRQGITVNCICPGPIDTPMTEPIPDEHKAIYAKRRVPLARYGLPEEVAHMTLSLCIPAASFLNGAIIPVDGGLSVKFG
jgi:3-oxoacyl-[acyl-carrier protein] reductase